MEFQVSFELNNKLFLRNPEKTDLGKQIVKNAVELIHSIGFENFTFKKLAIEIKTTEASIYRYFENKHRLLLYILNWYWSYIQFLVDYKLQNISNPKLKLISILEILTNNLPESNDKLELNKDALNQIVISESSKCYLVKDITDINKENIFKPYKDLCAKIAEIISEYDSGYIYPRSLSSTIIESSHQQSFFSKNLPRLTDFKKNELNYTYHFLENLIFSILKKTY